MRSLCTAPSILLRAYNYCKKVNLREREREEKRVREGVEERGENSLFQVWGSRRDQNIKYEILQVFS